jgi:3-mercaptopyruvate sulfurtransferase SseA
MRTLICVLAATLGVALLQACNSREGSVARLPALTQAQTPQSSPQQVHNPADSARRITAEELHALWEKNKVLIIDTRNDAAFKQSHIKGAILIPAGEVPGRIDELPKDKFIATYCT